MAVMATSIICTYNYACEVGCQKDRQIQFSRTGDRAVTIRAQVFVWNPATETIEGWVDNVTGSNITVEMESTTSKVHARLTKRDLKPDKLFTHFTIRQQDAIIGSLSPGGSRRIEVIDKPCDFGGLEDVHRLIIVDLS